MKKVTGVIFHIAGWKPMTVKELKEYLVDIPDDYEVRYEYDGPETNCEVDAEQFSVSELGRYIYLSGIEEP
jgi:hypothetical protein